MEKVHQELPILECVEEQFCDHFAQQEKDNNMPIELTNTTGTYLHEHMNDDCLIKIFSVTSLTLMDLCSLAETCKRFQQITQRVFPKEVSIDYNTSDCVYTVISHNYTSSEDRPSNEIKRILKNFGSFLPSMSISISSTVSHLWRYEHAGREDEERTFASNFILNLIERHCTLKFLKIDGFKIGKLKLKRLRFLEIGGATIMDNKTLFTDFESLRELKLIWVKNCNPILEKFVFPKLKRFTYENVDSYSLNRPLSTFISRHKNLKSIHLDVDGDTDVTIIMQAIANSCTKLKEFNVCMGRMNTAFIPLQALKLKTLMLHQALCENFGFVPALTKLRELHLYRCNLPNDSNQFALLTQLTKLCLHLDMNSTIEVVDVIIKRLINLEELEVSEDMLQPKVFVLDEETFSEIVGIVRGRPKILTLKCKFNFDLKNCYNNERVRLLALQ